MSRIVRASDQAFLVVFDESITRAAGERVRRLHAWLHAQPVTGTVDVHPGYATLLVRFDARRVPPAAVERELASRVGRLADHPAPAPRSFDVAVRYGGEDGPDLDLVAQETGFTREEVVARHAAADYTVRFLGFSPGFPYLEGLPEVLVTARRPAPRRRVPAGSVAIAGLQAGIYPVASPGGWNVIGRTDVVLFDASRPAPALLAPGDRVRFVAAGVER